MCRRVFDADTTLRPWFDRLLGEVPGVSLFDAHTHVGQNDPDGFKQTPEELLEALAAVDAKALVFPMHEPDGYAGPNDAVMEAVAASGGRLRALCRVQPKDPGAVAEARRCLDAGVNGIKLHPRAEQFGLDEPAVRGLVALAHERRLPVTAGLVHREHDPARAGAAERREQLLRGLGEPVRVVGAHVGVGVEEVQATDVGGETVEVGAQEGVDVEHRRVRL